MLAYRTVKSFFGFIIFSIKWFVILAALVAIAAYSLGNGNLEQGARVAAERGGLDLKNSGGWFDAIRKCEYMIFIEMGTLVRPAQCQE